MAIINIPTGTLPEEIVDVLPKNGEENKVYRRLAEDETLREMQITDDFIWYDDEWHPFSFDAKVFGAYFARYQEGVAQVIAELEARVAELEGDSTILFIGNNISLIEAGSSIEKIVSVASDITLTNGSELKISLSDMTIDGNAIEDVTGIIEVGDIPSWDWRGGELYSDVFGNSAYFSFGTKPLDGPVDQVTLGLTNEQEHFDERTLVIGNIKVEVL